jgi:hypothetical protein
VFGGSHIGPWRQCNAVSPAVTATQTGPGTHNGMGLTVGVLNNTNIIDVGPGSYDFALAVGVTGSNNAAAPAGVTVTPRFTGSSLYGAVNRNDAATVWTPAANTFFFQNAADATNGAAYGAFQLGASIAPIQSASNFGVPPGTFTITFPNPTTAGNTIVVCAATHRFATNSTVSGITLGGSAGNFASVVAQNTATVTDTEIWYDPVCAGGQTHVAVSFAGGSGAGPGCWAVAYEVPAVLTVDQTSSNFSTSPVSTWTSGATPVTTSVNEIWFGCAAGLSDLSVSGGNWSVTDVAGSGNPMGYSIAGAEAAAAYTGTIAAASDYTAVIAAFSLSTSPAYTVAGTPVTIGATNGAGGAGADGGVAVAEIPAAAGMMISEDTSAPPPAYTASAASISTARFTPPMNSLLVVMVATAGSNVGVNVTDDNGALTWFEQVKWASGTSGYAGIWTAVVVCG